MVMKGIMMMRFTIKIMNNKGYRGGGVGGGGLFNSCYKIVSPILIQKLINEFAVCKHQKHCSGTVLLVEVVKPRFCKLERHISKRNHTF